MSTQQDPDIPSQALTDQSVADYLRQHPDFFVRHPALSLQIEVPHECGGAVSLIEHQLNILRQQNTQLKRKMKELVDVGRENDRVNERMLKLTRCLVAAPNANDVLGAVKTLLLREFRADAVALRLFRDDLSLDAPFEADTIARSDPELSLFDSFFKNNRPLCGRLKKGQLEFLFGGQAQAIASSALIGLGDRASDGLLAIGSHDENRFHPSMGTLFLSRLGLLIGDALHRMASEAPARECEQ